MAESRTKFLNWDIAEKQHMPIIQFSAYTANRLDMSAYLPENHAETKGPLVLTGVRYNLDQIEIQEGSSNNTVRITLDHIKDRYLISLFQLWTDQANDIFDEHGAPHTPPNVFDIDGKVAPHCSIYCAFTKAAIITQLRSFSGQVTPIGLNLWVQGFDRRNSTRDGTPQTYIRVCLLSIAREYVPLSSAPAKRKFNEDNIEQQQTRPGFEEPEMREWILQTPHVKPKPKLIYAPLRIKKGL